MRLRTKQRTTGTRDAAPEAMSKAIPTIQMYMTTSPHSVGRDQTLAHTQSFMRKHGLRHLPVLDGGQLVGIITDRDMKMIEALRDVDPRSLKVEEAMATSVFCVGPDAPLDSVVEEMAERKYGCAVVMDNRKVVGIFTTVDVCTALAELLRARLR